MSGFVAATSGVQMIGLQDLRLNRMDFLPERLFADVMSIAVAPFSGPWWPGSGLMGDLGVDVGMLEASAWGEYDQAAGAASRYGFVGVTRDQWGTPVGSVTCKLFRTADNSLQDTTTSNATTGEFLLNTYYYPDAHYIVCHKSGSPDVDGASVNTLIGV